MFNSPKKTTGNGAASGGTLGDGLANGAEFAGTMLVFTLMGWLLDRALDTKPWFILCLTIFGIVGQFVRTWYTYDAQMKVHEANRLANVRGQQSTAATHPEATAAAKRSIEEPA